MPQDAACAANLFVPCADSVMARMPMVTVDGCMAICI